MQTRTNLSEQPESYKRRQTEPQGGIKAYNNQSAVMIHSLLVSLCKQV